MKTNFLKTVLILLTIVIIVSCSSDDDNIGSQDSNINQTLVENTVQIGTWRVTSFIDSGEDETYHYNGFAFTFGENNVLTAVKVNTTYIGSWSITDSNSNDDSMDDLDFNIVFASPENFEELSDDWDFISRTDSKIELIDISGGNGGTDYLTFQKN